MKLNKPIFDEASHTYLNSIEGYLYTSVTTLISKYKEQFDSEYWSLYNAGRRILNIPDERKDEYSRLMKTYGLDFGNKTVDNFIISYCFMMKSSSHLEKDVVIKKLKEEQEAEKLRWKDNTKKATDAGTKVHKYKEESLLDFGIDLDIFGLDVKVINLLEEIDNLSKLQDGVYPELMVWNNQFKIAGISDKITIETIGTKRFVDIDDYKTYKKVDTTSYLNKATGEYKKMLHPVGHIMDCVSGKTRLITKDNIEYIEDCINKEIEIWNGEKWSKVSPFITGENKKLYRISFNDGSYLDVTEGHRFLIKHDPRKTFEEKTTKEILHLFNTTKWTLRLPKVCIDYKDGITKENTYEYGFILGDGNVNLKVTSVDLYSEDKKCLHFNNVKSKNTYIKNNKEYFRLVFNIDNDFCHYLKYTKGLPKEIFSWNRESILSFVAGWIDADGSLNKTGLRLYGLKDKLQDCQLLLTKCGINSSLHKMSTKGEITNLGVRKNDVWYLYITKTIDIPTKRVISNNVTESNNKNLFQTIIDIQELEGLHNTYCLTEEALNQCVFNNVLTKQCNYIHASLQLSMYGYFLECFGFTIRNIKFTHIIMNEDKTKILGEQPYHCKYLREECISILKHYDLHK